MINISFGIHNKNGYYIHTLAAINSILKNTSQQIAIHIIHDNTLNNEEKHYFNKISNYYNQEILFYNIESTIAKIPNLPNIERFSKGCLFRLFLPKILPTEKVIYLDSDVIATTDITHLFNESIINNNEHPLKAVLDTAPHHREQFKEYIKFIFNNYTGYFNSGVLIFNNPLINNIIDDLPKKVFKILRERKELQFPDQDALNLIFGISKNVGYLSGKINFQLEDTKRINYNEENLKGKLLHYSWHKPWKMVFPAGLPYWKNREEINSIINK